MRCFALSPKFPCITSHKCLQHDGDEDDNQDDYDDNLDGDDDDSDFDDDDDDAHTSLQSVCLPYVCTDLEIRK